MKSKSDRIRKAGKECAEVADQRFSEKVKMLTTSDIVRIMDELSHTAIPQQEIDKLRRELDKATDKNRLLLSLANGVSSISIALKKILEKMWK